MDTAKEYLKKRIRDDVESQLKKVYGENWESAFEFFSDLSKHKIDATRSVLAKIKNFKYGRKKKRLLGTQTKPMPHSIFEKLLDFYKYDDKLYTAIKMQGYQGERVGDLLHTKLDQLDFYNHTLHCYNHKEKRWYDVPIKADLERDLQKYVKTYSKQIKSHNNCLFFALTARSKHDHWSTQYFNRKIVTALQKMGLEKTYALSSNGKHLHLYTSHSDRGHAATYVLNKSGHNYRAMQKLLDHLPGSMDATMLYEETSNEDLLKVMRD